MSDDYQPKHAGGVNDTTRRHEPRHGVRVPGLTVSPGSTMTRPDVPHRSIPETWRA